MNAQVTYRQDIDGLRCLAVGSVIAFHLERSLLPGGFVGVDIFFVISGFLISLQIFRQTESGTFTVGEFYRRRIKRIAPAMLVVIATVLLASMWLFRPIDAENTAHAAFWSLLSLANVYFWASTDDSYFADPSEEQPLLHYWSLGVEEQFYVIWPVLLILFGLRYRSQWFAVSILVTALAAFVFGELYYAQSQSFVYYMLPSRAGELMFGALVAWWLCRRPDYAMPHRQATATGIVCIAVLAASFWLIDETRPFPGLVAIPPTLATAVLILAGTNNDTVVTRALSLRPFVWVGNVSYSAYLWHWPILAFMRYAGVEINVASGTLAVALTFLLAWLSYRFVETPFRRTRAPLGRVFLGQYAAPAMLLLVAAAATMKLDGMTLHSLDDGYVARLEATRTNLQPAYGLDYVCQRSRVSEDDLTNPDCVLGPGEGEANVILWGDSNAAHYVGMLSGIANEAGFRFRNVEVGACPPLHGDPSGYPPARRLADCRASSSVIWPALQDYDTVVISANWSYYADRPGDFFGDFSETVSALEAAGASVILLGKAPIMAGFDRRCVEKQVRLGFMQCDVERTPIPETVEAANAALKSLAAASPRVAYYDANALLCPAGLCALRDASGAIAYFDSHHLNADASIRLGALIIREDGVPGVFDDIARPRHGAKPQNAGSSTP